MRKFLLFLILITAFASSLYSADSLVQRLKTRICDMSRTPFFQSKNQHELAEVISNKGNTTDVSLRELYWNTFQQNSDLDKIIESQLPDGSWGDISYDDLSLSNWQPTNHASRLLYMSRAYITPNSKFYHAKNVSEVLHRGINYWFQVKPVCRNWWYNEIGIPRLFGLVFLFMESELSPQEKENALTVLHKSGFRMTGQNKVWLAGNVLLRSLLANDESLARAARDTIASEIYTTEKEGIQPDFSFHQHGPQQQFGNYGLSFISSMSYYANVFGETEIEFSKSQISILRNYVFGGENWIVWRGFMDVNACNRQLLKQAQSGKALALCVATDQLKNADLENEKIYNDFIKRNLHGGSLSEKPESKHFWRSDLTVNRGVDHYISIRACSPRLIGTEFTNNENKKGHFIGDGTTMIMRRGDEFKDIFPIWDWNRLPGVTAPILDSIFPRTKTDDYRNPNPFVGGLAHYTNAISTFHLERNEVNAKKSWFYLNGILVCLGADIQSNTDKEIVTGVNQVLQRGKVMLISNRDQISFTKDTLIHFDTQRAVWHDSIGYFFPNNQKLALSIARQSGDWHSIADPYKSDNVSGEIFKLWIEHGVNASSSSSYEYMVLPAISPEKLISFVHNSPIDIVANSTNIQGVKRKDNSVFQFVFHQSSRINTFSSHDFVEAKNPGLVMIEKNKLDNLYFTVADPTQTLKKFRLIVSGHYSGKQANYNSQKNETTLTILLPQGGKAGSSVSFGLAKD